VVWRARTDGTPLLRAPLSEVQFQRRIDRYYTPYHETLRETAARLHRQHGHVVILAAHSMPSSGRRHLGGRQLRRADIVPGTRGRSTADGRIIDLVDAHFRSAGLSVKHDQPYRGGWTTASYGAPKRGQHAIQIELNRALYVDEETSEIKKDDFEQLGRVLDELGRLMLDEAQFATG
jgi:N-formylglutamate amidohydrolase